MRAFQQAIFSSEVILHTLALASVVPYKKKLLSTVFTIVLNSDSPWTLDKTLGLIHHASYEFEKVNSSSLSLSPPQLIYAWTIPVSTFKVNCNTTLFGCVLKDSVENWIKGCSGELSASSVLCCEFFAIWSGLILA
ncbi:hypothetical protein PIB30_022720 [Stylosanthes scabra]|uniref:Uncharacterized protein n=1 Tax=Stylosanthes scabra TaxID=79078 RepID=A0ABU6Y6A4_9FABA|nr:hypothetical protein [Stylosanthes scabra]